MRPSTRRLTASATVAILAITTSLATASAASAYQPTPGDLYVATDPASCNKSPCVLYPKSTQLPSGRILATFEDSQSAVIGQDLPVFKSDDLGATWQKLADVGAPAALSADPAVDKYTSNWTNAYLYVLPQTVGDLAAGTVLLASVVSGDDEYYNEQKATNPSWKPTGDGDRRDLAIALYASADEGATWRFVNIVAAGGWQGGSAGAIGRTSAANTTKQVDPVWEPYLMVHGGQLVAYYSDENDYLGYDATTGVAQLDPANATAPDSGGQILAHRTWGGTAATAWSAPVVDVAGLTQDRGNGKTQIGGGRPGMETVVPTTDGKWLVTYEYFGGGDNVHHKISDDPLRFFATGGNAGANISALPIASGPTLSKGGSPVLTTFPDGRIVYNAAGSTMVWVNETGRSDGGWKAYQTTMPAGYSRNLQPVAGTGRLLILQASWGGGSIGPVKFGEVDLGRSDGEYFTLVNRKTGQVLATVGDRTQDANLTGDAPDVALRPRDDGNMTRKWHIVDKGGVVTLLNGGGGRSVATWTGNAVAGQKLAQWVDDGGNDKQWTVIPGADGYVKLRSVRNTALFITGAAADSAVTLQAGIDSAADAAADDSQEWMLVSDSPPAAPTASYSVYTRCVASGVVLVVQSTSTDTRPIDVQATTAFGTRTATAIAAAGNVSQSLTTRQRTLPAGSVTFRASVTADTALTSTQTLSYQGRTCG